MSSRRPKRYRLWRDDPYAKVPKQTLSRWKLTSAIQHDDECDLSEVEDVSEGDLDGFYLPNPCV